MSEPIWPGSVAPILLTTLKFGQVYLAPNLLPPIHTLHYLGAGEASQLAEESILISNEDEGEGTHKDQSDTCNITTRDTESNDDRMGSYISRTRQKR